MSPRCHLPLSFISVKDVSIQAIVRNSCRFVISVIMSTWQSCVGYALLVDLREPDGAIDERIFRKAVGRHRLVSAAGRLCRKRWRPGPGNRVVMASWLD